MRAVRITVDMLPHLGFERMEYLVGANSQSAQPYSYEPQPGAARAGLVPAVRRAPIPTGVIPLQAPGVLRPTQQVTVFGLDLSA